MIIRSIKQFKEALREVTYFPGTRITSKELVDLEERLDSYPPMQRDRVVEMRYIKFISGDIHHTDQTEGYKLADLVEKKGFKSYADNMRTCIVEKNSYELSKQNPPKPETLAEKQGFIPVGEEKDGSQLYIDTRGPKGTLTTNPWPDK